MNAPLRIGTRGSRLALWQANYVADLLRAVAPERAVTLVEIETAGDQIRDVPLAQLGGQGAFTKEIQRALQSGMIDVAVHSLKDLPTFHVEGLVLAAVPERGPVGDAFVSHRYRAFAELPSGARVATSSVRRRAQILHRRPDLRLINIRGNVETRVRTLIEENLDATILAQAGLQRLGLQTAITEILDPSWMLPAVGQGALGLECRADDLETRSLLENINHGPTRQAVLCERALLRGLGGGCQVPVGAHTTIASETLTLRGVVIQADGKKRVEAIAGGRLATAEKIGYELADELLKNGAGELLDEPRRPYTPTIEK